MSVGTWILWLWFVAMLVSGCFVAGWCVREHWEDLKTEVKARRSVCHVKRAVRREGRNAENEA